MRMRILLGGAHCRNGSNPGPSPGGASRAALSRRERDAAHEAFKTPSLSPRERSAREAPPGEGPGFEPCLLRSVLVLLAFFFMLHTAFAQVDEAKAAIDRGEYVRAVNLLSAAIAEQPSADAYLYLGIAYSHQREWDRAEN